MTFIFRNRTIFWDISKWNRGQKKWDGGSNFLTLEPETKKQEPKTSQNWVLTTNFSPFKDGFPAPKLHIVRKTSMSTTYSTPKSQP